MLDKNALVSINTSIQNLDEKGMLDPSALKMILKEHLNETAEVFGNIDYLKKIFNFSLDLLVKKSIISSEEKDHYIKNLEILLTTFWECILKFVNNFSVKIIEFDR